MKQCIFFLTAALVSPIMQCMVEPLLKTETIELHKLEKADAANIENVAINAACIVAIKEKKIDELTRLLTSDTKPDINALHDIYVNKCDEQQTMLMLAAYMRSVKMTELLLQHGARPAIKNERGMTALMYAVGESFVSTTYGRYTIANVEDEVAQRGLQIAKILLAHGADINAQDNEGMTALMHLAAHPRKSLAEFLMRRGADVNLHDKDCCSALIRAANCGSIDVVLSLLYVGQAVCTPQDMAHLSTYIIGDPTTIIPAHNLLERHQTWLAKNPHISTLPEAERAKLYQEQYAIENAQATKDFEDEKYRRSKAYRRRILDPEPEAYPSSSPTPQPEKKENTQAVKAEKSPAPSANSCIIS